jgi:ubiquinone/menaquinone biosynthesis C-methylase UbiE
MSGSEAELAGVREFWNTEACGTHFVEHSQGDRDFFEQYRAHRYRTEWHIPLLVPFAETKGKRVLEIGTGNGADGVMFARAGADYTGVDLTETALDATRRHFASLGLRGTFQRENAERLSFPDASFDFVYSHGVLHHTPDTQAAIDEVYRVLRPGGRAVVMLYHKHSFNYHVRIMLAMRLRVLLEIVRRTGRHAADRRAPAEAGLVGVRGNQAPAVWSLHYRNFLREGWRYLRAERFVHHCTDGPECPVAYAFSRAQARRLFTRFREIELRVAHFPLRKYPLGRFIPFAVEKRLAPLLGWYLFIFASRPC